MQLVDEARSRAEEVLLACTDARGIKAAEAYYPHIWARDGMICLYGALLLQDERVLTAARQTLQTLGQSMNDAGHVPNFLPVDAGSPPRINNSLDSNEWYILGHELHYRVTGDRLFLENAWPDLQRALFWLRCQDYNDCGLLEAHEAADWADLLANRFNVLFTNVLYWRALNAMAAMASALREDTKRYSVQADEVGDIINALFFLPEDAADRQSHLEWLASRSGEWDKVYSQMAARWWFRPYYLPYIEWRIPGEDRIDTLGNLLCIVYGLADADRANGILDYIRDYGVNRPYPVKACYPVVAPGSPDWRDYYLNREYCKPHSAHNGGIWPFIGGFYVTALAKCGRLDEAHAELEKLAGANRLSRGAGEWGFNELIHGESGLPIGAEHQAWSAAMYVAAHEMVSSGRSLFEAKPQE